MRLVIAGLLITLSAMPAIAQAKKEPIALRDMGSFHIAGRIIEITGSRPSSQSSRQRRGLSPMRRS